MLLQSRLGVILGPQSREVMAQWPKLLSAMPCQSSTRRKIGRVPGGTESMNLQSPALLMLSTPGSLTLQSCQGDLNSDLRPHCSGTVSVLRSKSLAHVYAWRPCFHATMSCLAAASPKASQRNSLSEKEKELLARRSSFSKMKFGRPRNLLKTGGLQRGPQLSSFGW